MNGKKYWISERTQPTSWLIFYSVSIPRPLKTEALDSLKKWESVANGFMLLRLEPHQGLKEPWVSRKEKDPLRELVNPVPRIRWLTPYETWSGGSTLSNVSVCLSQGPLLLQLNAFTIPVLSGDLSLKIWAQRQWHKDCGKWGLQCCHSWPPYSWMYFKWTPLD